MVAHYHVAKALHDYKGAMILVSHVPDFVSQIHIDEVLDSSEVEEIVQPKL
ncbi:MAG: hypothetical protein R3B53_00080 [Candidatus Paceibacterota bacterium]